MVVATNRAENRELDKPVFANVQSSIDLRTSYYVCRFYDTILHTYEPCFEIERIEKTVEKYELTKKFQFSTISQNFVRISLGMSFLRDRVHREHTLDGTLENIRLN